MGPSAMDDYVKIEKIGEGTYGVVFKGKHKKTGDLVAIKKIRMDSEDEGIPSTAMREISILKELQHPNIVGLLKVIDENESRLYLIFEFLTMDLKKHLDSYGTNEYMSAGLLQSYTYQLCQAILFCHRRRILHRDLKPQNLLITGNGVIKLADFGLGRAIGIPVRVFTHEVVTLWYRAPEVLLGTARYCFPVDMWSIACIFAEMATKKPLFQGDSEIDQLFRIFRVLRTPRKRPGQASPTCPTTNRPSPNWTNYTLEAQVKNINKAGLDMLSKMLVYNPATRMTAKDAITTQLLRQLGQIETPLQLR
ncbi:hypothetical protein GE061_019035 [Apolygus lucorum]|uniref:Protein kinase domain-containing protein n=1 Tax=Apolygus lucorum TaxID=248454 RepID=A0A8S9X987_APOLU|nr:hypothetical protein GE061_019035 [Apolygus lucorum]